MPTPTDAAKELTDLCERIRAPQGRERGAEALASGFGVPAWSVAFYEIIFTIAKRIDHLKALIEGLENVDRDIRDRAASHLSIMQQAFSQSGLDSPWSHASNNFISAEHVNPIRMLSSEIRRVQPLPLLNEEEREELLNVVDTLLGWLREHQINEHDFIRQAIIDGLESFQFRVQRVSWVGWGYTLDSLRSVIGAYLALERGIDPAQQPDAQAVLMKVTGALKTIFKSVGVLKDTTEKANWLIESYKNVSSALIAKQGIVALITATAR